MCLEHFVNYQDAASSKVWKWKREGGHREATSLTMPKGKKIAF